MKCTSHRYILALVIAMSALFPFSVTAQEKVKIANGTIAGSVDQATGVRSFKGLPFGAPPVGEFRWKEPQPVKNWQGVRPADKFAARCMQRNVFGDMNFRANGMSEDCLYLNVWAPAKAGKKLPVLVYFYGGGFIAGDGSEPRYDGASMAAKGIVTVTVNYRLGVFGFFAHPELSKETAYKGSGNYGLMDQAAAIKWVQKNIAAFGGDPKKVTIAGESAGSISVSAQMASPLARNLIAGAIGESGSVLGALSATPLAEGEQAGVKFGQAIGKNSLAELRAMPGDALLESTAKPGLPRFAPTVDGYFFPKNPEAIFAAGEQARVPLLVGSNSEEMNAFAVLGRVQPTVENYRAALQRLYNDKAEDIFKLYPATNEKEVMDAAQDLAGDRFISFSTWKWIELATKTGGKPTYYYRYDRPRPAMRPEMGDAQPGLAGGVVRGQPQRPASRGAVHSAEIEYAMGNLDGNKVYAWTPDDYKVSKTMQEYFANFIKTGNPNGSGLANWPLFKDNQRMIIDVNTRAEAENVRARYEYMDRLNKNKRRQILRRF